MKRSSKKVVALVTASAMILSVAGCSKKSNKTEKAVVSAAEEFSEALIYNDPDEILDLCSADYDDMRDTYKTSLDFSNYGDDQGKAYDAILETIEYEVDDGSVEVEDDEASVSVVFTMVDYEAVAEDDDNMEDINAFLDAIDECEDTIEVETTFEFEKDEEDFWLITNLDDVLTDVYCFVGDEAISFGSLADYVDHTYFWFASDGVSTYNNVNSINCQLYLTEEAYELSNEERQVYYIVLLDGTQVYKSELSPSNTDAYWTTDLMSQSGLTAPDNNKLPEGQYTFQFYDAGDNLLAEDTCTVTQTSADQTSFSTYWWFTSGDHTYNDTEEIDCDLSFDDGGNYPVYYTVQYNGSVVYTSPVDSYSRYGYYGPEQNATLDASGFLPTGTYTITFYSDNDTVLTSDSVQVTSSGGTNPNPNPNPNPGSGTIDTTELGYEFVSDDFRALISDVSSGGTTTGYGWWDYNVGTICDGLYTTSDIVAFSLLLKDENYSQSIYYAYYFSEDVRVFDDDSFLGSMAPIYDATISPSVYSDGAYYDIDLNVNSLQPGYYFLLVADNSNLDNYLLVAWAGVQ